MRIRKEKLKAKFKDRRLQQTTEKWESRYKVKNNSSLTNLGKLLRNLSSLECLDWAPSVHIWQNNSIFDLMWFLERESCKRNRDFFFGGGGGALLETDPFLIKFHDYKIILSISTIVALASKKKIWHFMLIDSWEINKEYVYFVMATTEEVIK